MMTRDARVFAGGGDGSKSGSRRRRPRHVGPARHRAERGSGEGGRRAG
jgi:hypothetical protein